MNDTQVKMFLELMKQKIEALRREYEVTTRGTEQSARLYQTIKANEHALADFLECLRA